MSSIDFFVQLELIIITGDLDCVKRFFRTIKNTSVNIGVFKQICERRVPCAQ
jgi:hypothetical protein